MNIITYHHLHQGYVTAGVCLFISKINEQINRFYLNLWEMFIMDQGSEDKM